MRVPIKAKITLAIIVGIGLGTGVLVFGILYSALNHNNYTEHAIVCIAIGSGILTSSVAALVAHLAGGFRDIDEGP